MNSENDKQLEQANAALQSIREGDESVLKEIYRKHREEFLSWATGTYHARREDAADIFQDAVIIFHKNIVSGKLSEMNSSLKTYIFAIGRHLLWKRLGKKRKIVLEEEAPQGWADQLDDSLHYNEELTHRQQFVQDILRELTDACQQILTLFYYYRFSMESIRERMGFSSEEGARTAKHRCLKKFITMARERKQGLY
ncbi:MAG: sigma-70 family RNA polymerase sigma factor [Phaeodactylibacter sp.]|nr:sigma-70 family RNA polymerase sigma factor [Phaeodactylibacter sp.]